MPVFVEESPSKRILYTNTIFKNLAELGHAI